jgi:hypothetical protein
MGGLDFDDTRLADFTLDGSTRGCRIRRRGHAEHVHFPPLSYLAFSENCVCRTTLTLISPG